MKPKRRQSSEESEVDADLVRRFNAGDKTAFVTIVQKYSAALKSIAMRVLHNEADAEEVTQDTFISAYRNLKGFRGESSLFSWLHVIVFNLARNRYWFWFRRKRHLTFCFDLPVDKSSSVTFIETMDSAAQNPLEEVDFNELTGLVAEAMERLPDKQREILILRTVRNLAYEEMAEILGTSCGTIKSRLARARDALRDELFDSDRILQKQKRTG